jgi:tRNA threonylcarbamoyladenosine biosynthesis protein TsaB
MKQPIFIAIQGSYSNLQISLYKNDLLLDSFEEDNLRASSLLVPKIKDLLGRNSLTLDVLDFIAVDQGPGAFTSLRVVITIVNALAYANKIPLIGIDGLQALYLQTKEQTNSKNIVVIFNAYNNDVYFAFKKDDKFEAGYKKIDRLLEQLKELYKNEEVLFSGNAFKLHENLISQNLKYSFIDLQTCSVEQVAKMALQRWQANKKDFSYKLTPLYLKSQNFAIRSKKN